MNAQSMQQATDEAMDRAFGPRKSGATVVPDGPLSGAPAASRDGFIREAALRLCVARLASGAAVDELAVSAAFNQAEWIADHAISPPPKE